MDKLGRLNYRQQLIVNLLVNNDRVTSNELAKATKVTTRTIITDMAIISEFIESFGAQCIAKRNFGYSIKVIDEDLFVTLKELLRSKSAHMNISANTDKSRLIYVLCKLLISSSPIKMSELCEDLYISMSTLYPVLNKAYKYFASYHIDVFTNSKGIRISGNEQMLRVAMAELVDVKGTELSMVPNEFNIHVGCDDSTRQNIRHSFLKVLRNSGISVRDSVSHRLAMYLVIVGNRIKMNHHIYLDEHVISEVQSTVFYSIAKHIFISLQNIDLIYDVDQSEICFLAILLLCNLDINIKRDARSLAPYLNETVTLIEKNIINRFNDLNMPSFSNLDGFEDILWQALLPIVSSKHYGIDGYLHYDFTYKKTYNNNPLCNFFAIICEQCITETINNNISQNDIYILSYVFESFLISIDYKIRKLRVLTTNSLGTHFALVQTKNLLKRYSDLIESITPCELYEIRGFNSNDYDIVLCENVTVGKQETGWFGYNYDYPASTISFKNNGKDYNHIFNNVLYLAYRIDETIPYFHNAYFLELPINATQLNEFITYLVDNYSRNECIDQFKSFVSIQINNLYESNDLLQFIFVPLSYCKDTTFNVYKCKYGKNKMKNKYFIFMALGIYEDLRVIKSLSTILQKLTVNVADLQAFCKNPSTYSQRYIIESLIVE